MIQQCAKNGDRPRFVYSAGGYTTQLHKTSVYIKKRPHEYVWRRNEDGTILFTSLGRADYDSVYAPKEFCRTLCHRQDIQHPYFRVLRSLPLGVPARFALPRFAVPDRFE